MTTGEFVDRLLRYRSRHGVYAAAQTLRRQGISLQAAMTLLARRR